MKWNFPKNWLCRIGIHTWSFWSDPVPHGSLHIQQERYCTKCGLAAKRTDMG